ncbi:putative Sulfotransferase family cytosolic 1B member 1 [Hypsibius exemplaris]|uniref:Sulfotransferase family cytosolic 1B member 1 n=1 Tax=Hypsibius exemplaris TaxID=2072580 RepID=A0A9X6RP32_HYPEX|nr:putative Sulfotransferase family cytosolic 1B member 1 [Hypsibius exemplaris]
MDQSTAPPVASHSAEKAFSTREEFQANCRDSAMARKPGDPDFVLQYKGCNLVFPFLLSVPEFETFEANEGDVCVATFPKTGQTLMSAIALMVLSDGDVTPLQTGSPLKLKVPYLEMAFPRDGKWDEPIYPVQHLKTIAGPRIYGTHVNANALPAQLLQTAKILYVYRNPKDTVVSLFHFMVSGHRAFGFNGSLADAVEMLLHDQCLFAPFFEHLESFWKLRHQPNIHFVSFEEILNDPRTAIRNVGAFLGRNLNESQLSSIMHHCSFDQMKNNKLADFSEFETIGFIDPKVTPFMRAGKIGNWKKHLTVEMSEKIDAWVNLNFEQRPGLAGLTFQYEPAKNA